MDNIDRHLPDSSGYWPPFKYVTAYIVTCCYGGAEEGGWWYDEYEPIGISVAIEDNDVEAAREKVMALARKQGYLFAGDLIPNKYGDLRPARGHRSAAPEANCIALAEEVQGENESKGRPHYE